MIKFFRIISITILITLFLIPVLYLTGSLSLPQTHRALLTATVAWFGLALLNNLKIRTRKIRPQGE